MIRAKKAIESLYNGKCTVIEYQTYKDPITKRTTSKEVMVLENQPCRLSYKTIAKTTEGNVSEVVQVTKLFLDPSIEIKPGSKIVVSQNNRTVAYKNSGVPAIYSNHQEIALEIFERWS